MPSHDTKILKFIQYQKSVKAPFIIYAYLECIIEKINWCKNYPKNSSATKINEHFACISISTISSFRTIENKYDVYRGSNCMKKFCQFLREHAIKKIAFKKKYWSY